MAGDLPAAPYLAPQHCRCDAFTEPPGDQPDRRLDWLFQPPKRR
jgi:hypothetical protein